MQFLLLTDDLDLKGLLRTILPQIDFFIFSPVAKKVCDTEDETVIKIHKEIKTGIPEIDSFLLYLLKYSEFEAEIFGY